MTEEEKKSKSEKVQEASYRMISTLRGIRQSVDKAIEEVRTFLWVPREYTATFDTYLNGVAAREDGLIVPGAPARMTFGVEFAEPGSEIPGLPETARMVHGIEHPFASERLSIDDGDAAHFAVDGLLFGQKVVFDSSYGGTGVPASRFAESAVPPICFHYYIYPGASVMLMVRNVSSEPRPFRARLIGLEQPAV